MRVTFPSLTTSTGDLYNKAVQENHPFILFEEVVDGLVYKTMSVSMESGAWNLLESGLKGIPCESDVPPTLGTEDRFREYNKSLDSATRKHCGEGLDSWDSAKAYEMYDESA